MPTGEERRQAVDRVLAENPYEDNPQLWIFMIYVCMIFRRNGGVSFACFMFQSHTFDMSIVICDSSNLSSYSLTFYT
jgi:hypothetical protein